MIETPLPIRKLLKVEKITCPREKALK